MHTKNSLNAKMFFTICFMLVFCACIFFCLYAPRNSTQNLISTSDTTANADSTTDDTTEADTTDTADATTDSDATSDTADASTDDDVAEGESLGIISYYFCTNIVSNVTVKFHFYYQYKNSQSNDYSTDTELTYTLNANSYTIFSTGKYGYHPQCVRIEPLGIDTPGYKFSQVRIINKASDISDAKINSYYTDIWTNNNNNGYGWYGYHDTTISLDLEQITYSVAFNANGGKIGTETTKSFTGTLRSGLPRTISSTGTLIATINGRNYTKTHSGTAYYATCYRTDNNYSGPLLVSTTKSAVTYTSSSGNTVLESSGSFVYNGKTYYYSSDQHFWEGELYDTSGNHCFLIKGTNLEDCATKLLESNLVSSDTTISFSTPTRTGYTLNGWYNNASGGTKFFDGTQFTTAQNISRFATTYMQDLTEMGGWIYQYRDRFASRSYSNGTTSFDFNGADGWEIIYRPVYLYANTIYRLDATITTNNSDCGSAIMAFYSGTGGDSNWESYRKAYTNLPSNRTDNESVIFQCTQSGIYYIAFNFGYVSDDADTAHVQISNLRLTGCGSNNTTMETSGTFYAQWTANTYTVHFDSNGGTGSMADQTFTYDDGDDGYVSLTKNAFTRTGYTFGGWQNASGNSYDDEASVKNLTSTNGATVTLYAKWNANIYTVHFDSNGGTGSMADQTFTYDIAQNLTKNAFTRTGYTFVGWATTSTGSAVYADQASVKNLTATNGGTVTFYAVWYAHYEVYAYYNTSSKPNTYTQGDTGGKIFLNGNVAVNPRSVINYDDPTNNATLSVGVQANTGYTFGGWYTTKTFTDDPISTEASYSLTHATSATWYAKFSLKTYTVTLKTNNSNYGTLSVSGAIGGKYYHGTSIKITATEVANVGHYTKMIGTGTGIPTGNITDNAITFTIVSDVTMIGTFIPYWNNYVVSSKITHTTYDNLVGYEYIGSGIKVDLNNDLTLKNDKQIANDGYNGIAMSQVSAVEYANNVDVSTGTAYVNLTYTNADANNPKFYVPNGSYVTVYFNIYPYNLVEHENDTDPKFIATVLNGTYTGKKLEPLVECTFSAGGVTRDIDYTLVYANNINAGTANGTSGPYVTITGKGRFTGSITRAFTINPKDISTSKVKKLSFYYTGQALGVGKLNLTVTDDLGNGLTKGKDYTVGTDTWTNFGTYTFVITGTNNYTGTINGTITINELPFNDASIATFDVTWTNENKFVYTGSEITPSPEQEYYINNDNDTKSKINTVTLTIQNSVIKGYPFANSVTDDIKLTLEYNKDYYLTYKNNINAKAKSKDYATLSIMPKGNNFSLDDTKDNVNNTVNFEILQKSIDGIFSLDPSSTTYNGKDQAPVLAWGNWTINFAQRDDDEETKKAKDVYITCVDPSGEDKVNVYTGTWSKDFNFVDAYTYTITVTANGHNGNYTGTSTLEYTINKIKLDNTLAFKYPTQTRTYNGSVQKPDLSINTDLNNDVYQINYTYSASLTRNESVLSALVYNFEEISGSKSKYILTDIGTITFTFALRNENNRNYELQGTAPNATFTITKFSIEGKTLSYDAISLVYNGQAQTPTANITIEGVDGAITYDATYTDNTNAGLATATIIGNGNFAGTNSFTFTISPKNIAKAGASVENANTVYNGEEQVPIIKFADGEKISTEDYGVYYASSTDSEDYTYKPQFNHAIGTIKIKLEGQGNYTGNTTLTYTISQATIGSVEYTYQYEDWDGTSKTVEQNGQNTSKYYVGSAYTITNYILTTKNGATITLKPDGDLFKDDNDNIFSVGLSEGADFTNAGNVITITLSTSSATDFVYNSEIICTFQILPAEIGKSASNGSVAGKYNWSIANKTYTGDNISIDSSDLSFTSSYDKLKTSLESAKSGFEFSYTGDHQNAGTSTVMIIASGNFIGEVTTTFVINPYEITDATVTFTDYGIYDAKNPPKILYDRFEHRPEVNSVSFTNALGATTNLTFSSFEDKTIEYARTEGYSVYDIGNFTSIGEFSITITFTKNYTGTIVCTYSIVPRQLSLNCIQWGDTTFVYDGKSHKPNVQIVDDNLPDAVDSKNITGLVVVVYPAEEQDDSTYINAGTFTVGVEAPQNSHYNYYIANGNLGYYSQKYTINPRALSNYVTLTLDTLTYNGAEQTPTFTLKDNDSNLGELTLDKDYNATTTTATNAGKIYNVTVTGIGNYTGTLTQTGTMQKRNINTAFSNKQLTIDIAQKGYTGKSQTPTATVKDFGLETSGTDGAELGEGTDYTIKTTVTDNLVVNVGSYDVVIEGKGNYEGTITSLTFEIIKVHINKDTYTVVFTLDYNDEQAVFDGKVHKPTVTYFAVREIGSTEDYVGYVPDSSEISYTYDNTDLEDSQKFVYTGEYTIVFTPNEDSIFVVDSGSADICQTNYNITPRDISTLSGFVLSYTSREFDNTSSTPTVSTPTLNLDTQNSYELTESRDFEVSYLRNGVATTDLKNYGSITLELDANTSRNFKGQCTTLSYTITPRDISKVSIIRDSLDTLYYTGSVVKPSVSVTDGDINFDLTLDADYTLSYKASDSSNDAINAGTNYIVATGIGNYQGVARLMFEINKAIITAVNLKAPTGQYSASEQNIIVSSVMTNTNVNVSATDYSVYYKVAADSPIGSGDSDKTSVGTVYVIVVANSTSQNFTDSAYAVYTITPAVIGSIELNKSYTTYNTLSQKDNIKVKNVTTQSGLTLSADDYTLTYYRGDQEISADSEFVAHGDITIKVTSANINFKDNDPLASTVFSINQKSLADADGSIVVKYYLIDSNGDPTLDSDGNKIYPDDQIYQGQEVAPEVTYIYSAGGQSVLLTKDVDYVFTHVPDSWVNATEWMYVTVTAVNDSNYVDKHEWKYVISPAPWSPDTITIVIKAQVYTGQAITFGDDSIDDITASYKKDADTDAVTLTFGTDFVVATDYNDTSKNIVNGYANNINASTVALVVFRAINPNFSENETFGVNFTILPRDLDDTSDGIFSLPVDGTTFTYSGSKQSPLLVNPTYNYSNGTNVYPVNMIENVDYTVSYALNNDSTNASVEPIDANTYKLVMTGINNFAGTKTFEFVINTKALSADDVVLSVSDDVIYNGLEQKPIYSVTYNNMTLTTNDYEITFEYADFVNNTYASITSDSANFVNAGVYRLTITATTNSNYNGAKNTVYTIAQDNLTGISLAQTAVVYNGTSQQPQFVISSQNNASVTSVKTVWYKLTDGVWVENSSLDFVNVGNLRIVADAKGNLNFAGTVHADFEIDPKGLLNTMVTLDTTGLVYDQLEQRATVTLVDTDISTTALVLGKDYTLAYSNNINAGQDTALVTVSGIGNYTNILYYNYSIACRGLSDITLSSDAISDIIYTGSNISLSQETTQGMLIYKSYTLVLNTDFGITYVDTARTKVGNYAFSVTGMGNYAGTLSDLIFKIVAQDITNNDSINISAIDDQNYTGSEIIPSVAVWDADISTRDLNAMETNYTIEYVDNIHVHWTDGEVDSYAKVVITGVGNYTGTKTQYFKIVPIDINSNLVTKTPISISTQHYTGEAICPTPLLTFNGETVGIYYNYANNIDITTDDDLASVIVTANTNSDFVGSITFWFGISNRDLSWVTVTGITNVTYNTTEQKLIPTLTYIDGSTTETLVINENYALEYQNLYNDFTNVGHVTIVVTSLVGYSGQLSLEYDIVPVDIASAFADGNISVSGLATQEFDGTGKEQDKTNLQVKIKLNDVTVTIPQDSYTLSYNNNINAGNADISFNFAKYVGDNDGTLNNYLGSFTTNFTITKKVLELSMFANSLNSSYEYKGSPIEPVINLMYNGLGYSSTTGGYDVQYAGNKNVVRRYNESTGIYTVVQNTASVIITANTDSNFASTITLYFTITPKVAVSKFFNTTLTPTEFKYDSNEHRPTFSQFSDALFGGELVSGTDYVISSYKNNIQATTDGSKALVVVQFIQNYDGIVEFEFDIAPRDITELTIEPTELGSFDYDGIEHKVSLTLTFVDDNNILHTLVESDDYTLTYTRDDDITGSELLIHSGTINLTIVLRGNYTGSKTFSYDINKINFNDVVWTLPTDTSIYVYKNAQITPTVTATYNNLTFVLNSDYTVTYDENMNVATGGMILVQTTTSSNISQGTTTLNFDILPRQIALASINIGEQTEFVYTGSAILPSAITISDSTIDVDLLTLGTDYELSNTANILPGVVTITALGKGNYTGNIMAYYTILARTFSQDANVNFEWTSDISSLVYNRAEQTPNFRLTYTADGLNDVMTADADFSYYYTNNVNATTLTSPAKLTIRGKGGYEGSFEQTFEIQPYSINGMLESKTLMNRKYNGTSYESAILQDMRQYLYYRYVRLSADTDYTYVCESDIADSDMFVDVNTITITVKGINNFTGTTVATVSIVSKEINNIVLTIGGTTYYNGASFEYRGSSYGDISLVVRADADVIPEGGYTLAYTDEDGNTLDPKDIELTNVCTVRITANAIGNYIGSTYVTIRVNTKDISSDDISIANFVDSMVFNFGVPRVQNNIVVTYNTSDGNTLTLVQDQDYEIRYFNNAYVGQAAMQLVGKGNYSSLRNEFYRIVKRVAVVNPLFDNVVYFENDSLPVLRLSTQDTNGALLWNDENTVLLLGTHSYKWIFYPNDQSNIEQAEGTVTITAIRVSPISIRFDGTYKTEYNAFDKFDMTGLEIYLTYNNGNELKLAPTDYKINISQGDELYLDSLPVVTYTDGQDTVTEALEITVSPIKLVVTFTDTDNIVQKETAQHITPTIDNIVEGHLPSIITRYYSEALGTYTDGITQGGNYVISVVCIGKEYVIDGSDSINIYVKTGILKSTDNKIVVIDELGFEDGVRMTIREYSSSKQVEKVIDTRSFNIKKCYEIQLWKDGQEYYSPHTLLVRFNVGRDTLSSNKIIVYNIPSDTDIYYERPFERVDADHVELSTRVLGGFVFGEKIETVGTTWWIGLIVGIVIIVIVLAILLIVFNKRRRLRQIATGINIRLGPKK